MNELFLIIGMALITFAIRYPLLAISDRIKFPPQFFQVLRYIPPAILTAIVVPAVLIPSGNQIFLSYTNARLVGAIAALIVGFLCQNLLLTIVVGMSVFFVCQWLL
jgi:branched-subunit amino acid transport protein